MNVPNYLPYYVLGGTLATLVVLMSGLRVIVAKSGWPPTAQKTVMYRAGFAIVGWLVVGVALAIGGVYQGASERFPTVQFGLLAPILIGISMWFVPSVRRIVNLAPQSWVVGIQLYRALGVIFLILFAVGELPGEFALPAGAGDVLVGLTAPLVARAYARNPRGSRSRVLWWNILGMADLVIAVTTGVLTAPSPLQQLAFDRPNALITQFPLVLVPTYLVPLSILLHLASVTKLLRNDTAKGFSASETVQSLS